MLLDLLGSFIYCHSFSNLCALGVCYVTMLLVVGHSSDLIYARNIPKYAFDSFMNNTMPGPQLPVGVCWLFLECCFCCQLQIVKITISHWRCFAGAGLFGCDTGQLRLWLCIECMAFHKSHGYNVNATKDSLSNRHPLLEAACGVAACCCVAMHF